MFKRITALFLLTLFTGQLTASFLHVDCNMACCQEEVVSCCSVETVEMECPALGTNCDVVVFLPILSVPKAQTHHEFDLNVNQLAACTITRADIMFAHIPTAPDPTESPPVFFLTPLLL